MDEKELRRLAERTGATEEELRKAVAVLGHAVTGVAAAFRQAMELARASWEEIEAQDPQADLARMKQEVKTERHPMRKRQLQREIQRLQFEIKRKGR
ncbi:hypothetical protein HWB91_gp61 [Bacillus phage vB_BboS-125]|uniref:Uncharacterized protein n=1 Tax=Bacillus phage vB_BboS-125 TaxID=2419618 RepID=A0A3G3BWI0_9CAUD|nr:hypothetical protein HWB91_gp61 [Bacillus phage vB_BboS-125]AYP68431.1 hypothetical protein BboS125_00062 [Bacillus phage vB_BboS-125]